MWVCQCMCVAVLTLCLSFSQGQHLKAHGCFCAHVPHRCATAAADCARIVRTTSALTTPTQPLLSTHLFLLQTPPCHTPRAGVPLQHGHVPAGPGGHKDTQRPRGRRLPRRAGSRGSARCRRQVGGGGQWPVFTGREGEKVPLWCAPACGVGSGVCGRRQQGCGLQCPGVGQQSPCLRSYGEECPFWNGLVVKTWQTTISNNIRWLAGCGSLLPLLLLLPPTSQT